MKTWNYIGRNRLQRGCLPLALAAALLGITTQALAGDNGWVATRTQAEIVRNTPASARLAGQPAPQESWTLRLNKAPTVAGSAVRALVANQPLQVQVGLNLRDIDGLEQLLREQQDPNSPNYHRYLTPEQFKARFAPTDAQVQAVAEHLKSYGFTDISPSKNNLLIAATGTAGTASVAFHTSFKSFEYQGKEHYANAAPALVPQALAGVVDAVLGLQNVSRLRTFHHVLNRQVTADAQGKAIRGHDPTDFAAIYGAAGLPTASKTPVGIVVWGGVTQTIKDLNAYIAQKQLPPVNIQVVKVGTGRFADDNGAIGEWNLDSQTIVGTSGGVQKLVFYSAPTASSSAIAAVYNRIVADNAVKVINLSFGADESDTFYDGSQAVDDRAFAQAAAQGQTFSVASGDAGVYGWSQDPIFGSPGYVADGNGRVRIDLAHYSASEPATSPYVVSVGGTLLSTNGNTEWAGETTWNQGLERVLPPFDNNQVLGATGGGRSDFEAVPYWQLGLSSGKRLIPDVAFDADPSSGGRLLVNGNLEQVGGTSLASPIFVGLWARIESAHGNSLGLPNAQFYQLFARQPGIAHDVVTGNNGYGGFGYKARVGYDQTTGWGSFNAAALSSALK